MADNETLVDVAQPAYDLSVYFGGEWHTTRWPSRERADEHLAKVQRMPVPGPDFWRVFENGKEIERGGKTPPKTTAQSRADAKAAHARNKQA